jgi:quercetin dioxygenase-like cupin family protein
VAKAETRTIDKPDNVVTMERGKIDIVEIAGGGVARLTLEPGWEWSKHEKPLVNTEWCEVPHFFYVTQGTLHIKMRDGDEFDLKAGDIVALPAGHDGWVVGDETVVGIDWSGCTTYGE